jgi:hypothetical protein
LTAVDELNDSGLPALDVLRTDLIYEELAEAAQPIDARSGLRAIKLRPYRMGGG